MTLLFFIIYIYIGIKLSMQKKFFIIVNCIYPVPRVLAHF